MNIIEYHQGCGSDIGCMGPNDPFYTIFNTQLKFIYYPLLFSLIPMVIVAVVLFLLKKKNIIGWSNKKVVLVLSLIYLLSFIWFANWTWVVY